MPTPARRSPVGSGIVQGFVRDWLDATAPRRVQVVSVCAGDGRDLLEVLVSRADAERVTATLVELDPGLAEGARRLAAGLPGVEVRTADAGDPAAYAGLPPADLVLLCGVLGNVSDADAEHVLSVLPALCADGARVIWTRTRRAPDLTPSVRAWLGENGFREVAFAPVPDSLAAVGVADLGTRPEHAALGGSRLFTFLDTGAGTNAATLAVYEERADRYRDGLSDTPAPWHREFLDGVVHRLPAGARVLELGSGTGRDAAYLLERGLALQPSDAVAAFLEQQRERGLDPVKIDVLTDDLGGPWAAVVASAVLLHLTPGELGRRARPPARGRRARRPAGGDPQGG